jgi:hypothetical protein
MGTVLEVFQQCLCESQWKYKNVLKIFKN